MPVNFDETIAAHAAWMSRLRAVLDGRGETPDSALVGRDDQCDLGRWIHGEGAAYRAVDSYERLKTSHARFHRCAALVIDDVTADRRTDAEARLRPEGEFASRSNETVMAIMAMQRAVMQGLQKV